MIVASVLSTKGGVGKTTTVANLGGIAADAGLRVVLVDLDTQPTLSSYYSIAKRAVAGTYELLAYNESSTRLLVSQTAIKNLDVVLSNDHRGQLNTLLLHAPDGRLRLRHLLPAFKPHYDLMLIDTQGARSVLLEAAVLASDIAVSPVTPEVLAARELQRGTLQLMKDLAPFQHWGIASPVLQLLLNRVPAISANARLINQTLRQLFAADQHVTVLQTQVPAIEAYPRAAALALPAHRVEYRRARGRLAPPALETMRTLSCELFPHWSDLFADVRLRGQING